MCPHTSIYDQEKGCLMPEKVIMPHISQLSIVSLEYSDPTTQTVNC